MCCNAKNTCELILKKFIRFEVKIVFKVLLTKPNSIKSQLTVLCVLGDRETGRHLETRLNEHKKETEKVEKSKRNFTRQTGKQSGSEPSKSAIADHAVQHNHMINWQDAKILAKECVSNVSYIKEAIWIRRRAPNTMNRDEGGPLSQSCIWSSSGHAYIWWLSEQRRWSNTIILMKCVDRNTQNCQLWVIFFWFC